MFLSNARETVVWFEDNVRGLREQIRNSAGYAVFPDMLQYGSGFGAASSAGVWLRLRMERRLGGQGSTLVL